MSRAPKLAALAVVIRDNDVIMVQRKNEPDAGLWGFPGGHVELGERGLEAAVRELAEETGVIATPVSYLTNLDLLTHHADGSVAHHFLLAAVLCDYISGEPSPMDDALQAQWVPIETVLAGHLALSQDVAGVLRIAQRQHEKGN